jgi:hypothetical protein
MDSRRRKNTSAYFQRKVRFIRQALFAHLLTYTGNGANCSPLYVLPTVIATKVTKIFYGCFPFCADLFVYRKLTLTDQPNFKERALNFFL